MTNEEIIIDESEVSFKCLPKSLSTMKEKNPNIVCNDLNVTNYSIDKITYFIDIELKYHILGTMWVLLSGEKLLRDNKEHIYGNILDKNFKNDNTILFKPYHKEYSKWRDNAILHSEHLMNNDKRCLMIALDIKDYYYSVDIDFNQIIDTLELKEDIKEGANNSEKIIITKRSLLKKLTNHIENMLEIYSDKILELKENEKNIYSQ